MAGKLTPSAFTGHSASLDTVMSTSLLPAKHSTPHTPHGRQQNAQLGSIHNTQSWLGYLPMPPISPGIGKHRPFW